MIVFFLLLISWKKIAFIQNTVFEKIIIKETKDAQELPKILKRFKNFIDEKQGVVMFAVMNGKLSERINFANEYCRCVMLVGMPFPDRRDFVLQQRM
jgi:chromosome transmission fidelity protein 1